MDRKQLSDRLVYLADLLESLSDSEDRQLIKEVRAEYRQISNELYPPTKKYEIPAKQIKESRDKALEQIKLYLEKENIEEQFKDTGEKKIVVWLGNVNGLPKEFTIEGCDSFYTSYSGHKCITARRCLFSEKQLKGYHSWERALLETGLKLCSNRKEKQEFFNKYVTKYNERIKQNKNGD